MDAERASKEDQTYTEHRQESGEWGASERTNRASHSRSIQRRFREKNTRKRDRRVKRQFVVELVVCDKAPQPVSLTTRRREASLLTERYTPVPVNILPDSSMGSNHRKDSAPMQGLVTFTDRYPQQPAGMACPGQAQGVYILLHPDMLDDIAGKIERWFADRPEVRVIDVGSSDKRSLGFIIVEWLEYEVDPLFLAILRDEEVVGDYTVYGRLLEG